MDNVKCVQLRQWRPVDSGRIARYARSNIVRHYRIEVDKADPEMPAL
jgi:hypothetical protein